MIRKLDKIAAGAVCVAALALVSPTAHADPGDVLRVSAARLNLRAGPSDDANVRSQMTRGEEVLELRRSGQWLGVRALRTGEEGWVFSELVEPVLRSTLDSGVASPATVGFAELSRDFDQLMALATQRRGFPLVDRIRQREGNELEVAITPDWLRAGSADEHMMGALAIYQMWKNHQNGAPVRVVMLEPAGQPYISIDESGPTRPMLSVAAAR